MLRISEAKARLAALVREVAAYGEGYVISVNGHPIAELRPFVPVPIPAVMLNDFAYVVEADGFRMLDVDAASAIRAGQLAGAHRDPFDRLIGAQALAIGAAVVTNDAAFTDRGVEVFWQHDGCGGLRAFTGVAPESALTGTTTAPP